MIATATYMSTGNVNIGVILNYNHKCDITEIDRLHLNIFMKKGITELTKNIFPNY